VLYSNGRLLGEPWFANFELRIANFLEQEKKDGLVVGPSKVKERHKAKGARHRAWRNNCEFRIAD
jgi:hypothetical protein